MSAKVKLPGLIFEVFEDKKLLGFDFRLDYMDACLLVSHFYLLIWKGEFNTWGVITSFSSTIQIIIVFPRIKLGPLLFSLYKC